MWLEKRCGVDGLLMRGGGSWGDGDDDNDDDDDLAFLLA